MRKSIIITLSLLTALPSLADEKTIASPQGNLVVTVSDNGGQPTYSVSLDGKQMLTSSRLGLRTNVADFTQGLTLTGMRDTLYTNAYTMTRSKQAKVEKAARRATLSFENADKMKIDVEFYVSDNDIAFRYNLKRPDKGNPKVAKVLEETSSFNFPTHTTTFISPQITPMTGWERTKPSYEEVFSSDAALDSKSQYGVGYTFPCLFHVGDNGWVLVSETGVTSEYVGSRLSDYAPQTGFTIAYPQEGELNGNGQTWAAVALPSSTPWRTITVASTLKPIAETTIPFDVVSPQYEPSQSYQPGRYTWSWLIWQDNSLNYKDQVAFIDVAAKYGYEYCLVDGLWDKGIGREGMERLAKYAAGKGVNLLVWYNSNGYENDAPQGPRGIMSRAIERKKEMAWLKKLGVKGIKVDFFGGDKQQTMQLYEDILSDANDYGIQVIFHGCTLPRGWERMYPNYVGSEAALASENVYFTQEAAQREAYDMTLHPFARNAVGSFDWGGVMMNHYMSRNNHSRHQRATSDVFEMATAITNQASVNCVAVTPQVVDSMPQFVDDYLKAIPTAWQETQFIDGYPTKYVVMARKAVDGKWYVGGLNAEKEAKTITLQLPQELAGKVMNYYYDQKPAKGQTFPDAAIKELKVDKNGCAKVTIQPMGGIVLTEK